jgi:hypothetical protein
LYFPLELLGVFLKKHKACLGVFFFFTKYMNYKDLLNNLERNEHGLLIYSTNTSLKVLYYTDYFLFTYKKKTTIVVHSLHAKQI